MNRPPISVGKVATATVKVEPSTVTSMANGPPHPHVPSVMRPASQMGPSLQTSSPPSTTQEMITGNKIMVDLKPDIIGMPQSVRPVPPAAANVSIPNNLSQGRLMNSAALTGGSSISLPSMNQTPVAMHMLNMISSGMTSSVSAAQNVFSSGRPGINSITGSGTLTGTCQVAQNFGHTSFTMATTNIPGNSNLGISQPVANIQGVSMGQSISPVNLPAPQMVQSGMGMNQNMMNGLGPSSFSSGTGTMILTPGMFQQVQSGMQSIGVNNSSAANMQLSQQTPCVLQSAKSKYVKVWEGNLSGQRQGQPVFITRLEGYRSNTASEMLAANWPLTMQIIWLISQDHMKNKQHVGKADFLVFRAMSQHRFLRQLQVKKLPPPPAAAAAPSANATTAEFPAIAALTDATATATSTSSAASTIATASTDLTITAAAASTFATTAAASSVAATTSTITAASTAATNGRFRNGTSLRPGAGAITVALSRTSFFTGATQHAWSWRDIYELIQI